MRKILLCSLYCLSLTISAAAQLVLGNPSNAIKDVNNPDNFLVVRPEFILSYNRSRGTANWVAWHLTVSDIGPIRKDVFQGDPLLPKAWRISSTGYKDSGYQRGHMCPSKDRSTTLAINRETFVMSNMQPQTKQHNEVAWGNLEDDTRALVKQGNEAYIYAGCYGNKGRIKNKVTIPTFCYKIVIVLPEGNNDLERITENTNIIVVSLPNTDTVQSDWRQNPASIDEIEKATGFDFLSTLPNAVEKALEKRKAPKP